MVSPGPSCVSLLTDSRIHVFFKFTRAECQSPRSQSRGNEARRAIRGYRRQSGVATASNVFGGEDTKKYIIETTGTGVAIFDYDNDGWPDIFLVNGTTLEGFPAGKLPPTISIAIITTEHSPTSPPRPA